MLYTTKYSAHTLSSDAHNKNICPQMPLPPLNLFWLLIMYQSYTTNASCCSTKTYYLLIILLMFL